MDISMNVIINSVIFVTFDMSLVEKQTVHNVHT